ncbi:MAG: hypothetical protein KAI80_03705 [Hyphomicrobiaceae bacterium]|nr:hypothetical protein [Hyphomicrobiaceae bacterium]
MDRTEERVTTKIQKAHDRIDEIAERTTRAEVRQEQAEKDYIRLESAVGDVALELKQATGAFSAALIEAQKAATAAPTAADIVAAMKAAEPDTKESADWRRMWREAATPSNLVRLAFALVAFGTVVAGFLKGQADVQDLRAALEAANTIAPISAPMPAGPPIEAGP